MEIIRSAAAWLTAVMVLVGAETAAVTDGAREAALSLVSPRERVRLEAALSPEWVTALPQAEGSGQMLVVAGTGGTAARVTLHEKDGRGRWHMLLSADGYVGRNGMCPDEQHYEGCGQTPIGVYGFNRAFGNAEDPGCAIPYKKVDKFDYWSGDTRPGMHYNEMVSLRDLPDLDRGASEHLIDFGAEYRYCLNISFNTQPVPGKGSAIFLHCTGAGKTYTGGCVAIPEAQMKRVMQLVEPECTVVIDYAWNLGCG